MANTFKQSQHAHQPLLSTAKHFIRHIKPKLPAELRKEVLLLLRLWLLCASTVGGSKVKVNTEGDTPANTFTHQFFGIIWGKSIKSNKLSKTAWSEFRKIISKLCEKHKPADLIKTYGRNAYVVYSKPEQEKYVSCFVSSPVLVK